MQTLLTRGMSGPDVAALRQALAQALGAAAAEFPGLAAGQAFDEQTEAAVRRWQAGTGLLSDGVAGPWCQQCLGLRPRTPLALDLRTETVRRLFPATKPANVERYLPYVSAALQAAGLTDRPMLLAALGTIRAESEGFVPLSEFISPFNTPAGQPPYSAYVGRLGNKTVDDAARYKGRGFVQLTGRVNYEKYGQRLGIDLVNQADWANGPEVAAVVLAAFLADKATAMRAALAANDLRQARKLVNGGSHGLDRFTSVFDLAQQVFPVAVAAAGAAGVAGAAAGTGRRRGGRAAQPAVPAIPAATPGADANLTARKDTTDLRDRPFVPQVASLRDAFPGDAEIGQWLPRYARAGLILDQGSEGACTGFGLACVINYLRWVKAGAPARFDSVSPRMLYTMARRNDEYTGENYEGSSCRGALKGWHRHGVCEETDWPYDESAGSRRFGYAQRAHDCTLGVYFRIEMRAITDLQAAIQQVGAVFVSGFTHPGWRTVTTTRRVPRGHADLPLITFDGQPSTSGGHAFALVGFNARGFIVQNSWGNRWGAHGFAVLSYADWLANGMDAWVAALGVPGVLPGQMGLKSAAVAAAGAGAAQARWWDEARAYRHSVVMGDDGRVSRYLTEDEGNRNLLHQVANLPAQWFQRQPAGPRRLVLYVHGGLNSEAEAIKRARAMGRHFLDNGCYPLFVVWKTGLVESIVNILKGTHPAPRAGGLAEWATDKTDLLLERTLARPFARPLWSEMRLNAALAFGRSRGGDLLVNALASLRSQCGGNLELHLVGHSAGAIWIGHLLSTLSERLKIGFVDSVHLYAPACTLDFANSHYAQHPALMKRLYLDLLSDRVERDDNTGWVYRKSLLYLVSNALEADQRMPLLGLAKAFRPGNQDWDGSAATAEALTVWQQAARQAGLREGDRLRVIDSDRITTALAAGGVPVTVPAGHGSFDNDVAVVGRTLQRILGAPPAVPVDDLRGF